jgi:murein DD-endopeptidase MepM/ murein hydrolase activator NlpD
MPGLALPNLSWVFPLPRDKSAPASHWTLDQGVDIAAPAHTPLYAVGSGTIVKRGIPGFGPDAPVLKLDGGHGYVYYGHAGPAGPKVGTRVNAGDVVGEVGAGRVGISTGPHLEIGLSDANGNPLKGQAPTVKTFLSGANDPGGSVLPDISLPDVPNPLKSVGDLISTITNPRFWIRVVEVLVGIALLLMGLKSFSDGAIDPIGAAAGAARRVA